MSAYVMIKTRHTHAKYRAVYEVEEVQAYPARWTPVSEYVFIVLCVCVCVCVQVCVCMCVDEYGRAGGLVWIGRGLARSCCTS